MVVQSRHNNLLIFLGFLTEGRELYLLCVYVRELAYDTTHFKQRLSVY
jgi:hypothetical protein